MKKLNRDQVLDFIATVTVTRSANPTWRWGQVVFNVGRDMFPVIFEGIRGSKLDPFYDNTRVDQLIQVIFEPEGLQAWYNMKFRW